MGSTIPQQDALGYIQKKYLSVSLGEGQQRHIYMVSSSSSCFSACPGSPQLQTVT